MLIVLCVLVVLNLVGIGFLFLRSNQTQDFSFLSQEIKPLSDKMVQLEVIMQQRFENQKEVTRLQVSEIIEDKFKKIAAEQNKTSQDLIEKFGNFQHILTQQLVAVNEKLTQEMVGMNTKMTVELVGMKEKMAQELVVMNEKITKSMQEKLNEISDRVRENLDQGFKKTNETFTSVIERLAKIDEAQKKIESLSTNVVSLQDILTDKKSRGIFGEVQLNQILNSVFGDKNDKVYKIQHKLSNGTICDSILFLPEPTGSIVVDSKFPLENFRRMFDLAFTDLERREFAKDFKINLKKHIDDISNKYIIAGETTDQAILFLPAEAIFAEIYAYHSDIIEYAQNKKVWLTSPTTFMAMITTIQVVIQNIERSKYTNVIHQELNKLADEFGRYKKRWDNLASHIETVSKDVKDIHTTTEKITNRFSQISEVKIDNLLE
ncbi:DNA recombination protein RmuC [Bacteriovorax sp. PP10]|uniref:DNA recombination protein RmuC n=1 Tax=Bacteriovorax antarcticus TaxID=3088717 RepID=A0ABU5VWU0_9BACT|nr:DNA recombination protein RmuC [Bacteriovorax sp. PP10]MEA9357529.1 DNA recombination protein RmuC [Bacteriovorax sp. PP10]